MDLKNIKNNADLQVLERQKSQRLLEKDKESLQEQLREAKEKIFKVENQRNKEVKSLKQQAQIIEETLA